MNTDKHGRFGNFEISWKKIGKVQDKVDFLNSTLDEQKNHLIRKDDSELYLHKNNGKKLKKEDISFDFEKIETIICYQKKDNEDLQFYRKK